MTAPQEPLSDRERRILREAGIALFAGRLILDAQPPVDEATVGRVAGYCAGPLPQALLALWRTAFGGRIDYDLRATLDGEDAPVSVTELFHPDSDHYHDLWGWIGHELELLDGRSDRLEYLPVGGFEYLERVYVRTTAGPGHGTVVCWRQGLPPGWELRAGDRAGRIADDVRALFARLTLERDPWEIDEEDTGTELRDAVDGLAASADPEVRAVAERLRRLVRATVLDWRGALDAGTLMARRRLRRLALDRAAAADDVDLLARLEALGCDPAEEVRAGLTPLDVALQNGASGAVRWLLGRRVPVRNALRVGAHTVDLDLARSLLDRGASVDGCTVTRALDNDDVEVVRLLSTVVRPDDALARLVPRLRMLAAQARIAGGTADDPDAALDRQRSEVLAELADRFGS